MIKQTYSNLKVSKAVWILFFTVVVTGSLKANPFADTTKKKFLAATSAKENSKYITLEPNVVFPDVLTGNEEATLAYIEKFSENRRAYLIRTYVRSKKYFPKATAILKKYNYRRSLKFCLRWKALLMPMQFQAQVQLVTGKLWMKWQKNMV